MFERRDKLGKSKGGEALRQVRVHLQPPQGLVAAPADHTNAIFTLSCLNLYPFSKGVYLNLNIR